MIPGRLLLHILGSSGECAIFESCLLFGNPNTFQPTPNHSPPISQLLPSHSSTILSQPSDYT